jgi:hypothetical protein
MTRILSMRHTIVPSAERADFRKRAQRLRDHYVGSGCRYWLFEEASLPGAYLEFFEAGDADVLRQAHGGVPGSLDADARSYVEVDLF